jgi:hypothetical protein
MTPFTFVRGYYVAEQEEYVFLPNNPKAVDIASLNGAGNRKWQVLLFTSGAGLRIPGVDVETLRMTTDFSRYSGFFGRHYSRLCAFVSELTYHTRGLDSSLLLFDVDGSVPPNCYALDFLLPDAVRTGEHLAGADIYSAGRMIGFRGDEAQVRAAAWVDANILNKNDFGLAGRNLIQGSPSNVCPIFALVAPSGRLVGYIRGKHKAKHLAAALIRQIMSDPEWSASSHMLDDIYSEDMLSELDERNDGDGLTNMVNAALHTFGVGPIYDDNNYYPVARRLWPKDRFNRPMASDLFWLLVKGRSGPSLEDLKGFYEEANKEERFRQMMSQMYKESVEAQK